MSLFASMLIMFAFVVSISGCCSDHDPAWGTWLMTGGGPTHVVEEPGGGARVLVCIKPPKEFVMTGYPIPTAAALIQNMEIALRMVESARPNPLRYPILITLLADGNKQIAQMEYTGTAWTCAINCAQLSILPRGATIADIIRWWKDARAPFLTPDMFLGSTSSPQ